MRGDAREGSRSPRRLIAVPRKERSPVEELLTAIPDLTGFPASMEHGRMFSRYLELMLLWNRTHDLTGLKTPAKIVKGLFQDALLFFPLLPRQRPLRVADIGTGAGIPGVPLRIVDAGLRLTLVEARRKRVSFLATVKRELGLVDMDIIHGRAEAVVSEHPALKGQFDAVVSRAAAPPPELIGTAALYLKPGGLLVASGPPPGARTMTAPAGMKAEWREVPYPALGLKRLFFVATCPG